MIKLTKINATDYQFTLNGKYLGIIDKMEGGDFSTCLNCDVYLSAKDHREIADKLDELNKGDKE